MTKQDDTQAATKGDIQELVKAIEVLQGNVCTSEHALRNEIKQHKEETTKEFQRLEKLIFDEAKTTREHFDVVAENLKYDYDGIFADRTSQHDDKLKQHDQRISRIEDHLELIA